MTSTAGPPEPHPGSVTTGVPPVVILVVLVVVGVVLVVLGVVLVVLEVVLVVLNTEQNTEH